MLRDDQCDLASRLGLSNLATMQIFLWLAAETSYNFSIRKLQHLAPDQHELKLQLGRRKVVKDGKDHTFIANHEGLLSKYS